MLLERWPLHVDPHGSPMAASSREAFIADGSASSFERATCWGRRSSPYRGNVLVLWTLAISNGK